jgi:hypothetical protein
MSGRSRYIIDSLQKLLSSAAFISFGAVSFWNNIVLALQAAHIVYYMIAVQLTAYYVQQFCMLHVTEFDAAFTNVVSTTSCHKLYHIGTCLHTSLAERIYMLGTSYCEAL